MSKQPTMMAIAFSLAGSNADPDREKKIVQSFAERRMDGIIVTSSRVGALYLPLLFETMAPIILVTDQHPRAFVHSVMICNQEGCRMVAECPTLSVFYSLPLAMAGWDATDPDLRFVDSPRWAGAQSLAFRGQRLKAAPSPPPGEFRISSAVDVAANPSPIVSSREGISFATRSSVSITLTWIGASFEQCQCRVRRMRVPVP